MPNVNKNLCVSKSRIDDEFYTPYWVVKRELKNHNLMGKNIYCPFDDERSAFVQYLLNNFGSKEIGSVTYSSIDSKELVTVTEYHTKRTPLDSGDFNSPTIQELIKKKCFDLIITNPPFSLIEPFFKLLFEAEKRFVILASNIVISRKSLWPYYVDNKIKASLYLHDESIMFDRPDGSQSDVSCTFWHNRDMIGPGFQNTGWRFDAMKYEFLANGCLFIRRWNKIPDDWFGLMAVPVNGAWRINREQFEILGKCSGVPIITPLGLDTGNRCFTRIIVRRK